MDCGCGIGDYQNVVVAGTTFLMSGNNGTLLGVTPSVDVNGTANADTNSYLILFGKQIPNLTGQGVFLNPQGIVNAATYAPWATIFPRASSSSCMDRDLWFRAA